MSAPAKGPDQHAWALLALQKSAPASPSVVPWSPERKGTTAIARLEGKEFEYMIRQSRVVIGRNSSKGDVDVNMGHNSFISRKHIEIYFDTPHFYMLCNGKNGVFVDGAFQRKGALPLLLPKMCTMRFPSTNIKIQFQSLVDEFDPPAPARIASPPKRKMQPLRISIPEHDEANLTSPFPSPTGTISAANSCPTSPRSYHGNASGFGGGFGGGSGFAGGGGGSHQGLSSLNRRLVPGTIVSVGATAAAAAGSSSAAGEAAAGGSYTISGGSGPGQTANITLLTDEAGGQQQQQVLHHTQHAAAAGGGAGQQQVNLVQAATVAAQHMHNKIIDGTAKVSIATSGDEVMTLNSGGGLVGGPSTTVLNSGMSGGGSNFVDPNSSHHHHHHQGQQQQHQQQAILEGCVVDSAGNSVMVEGGGGGSSHNGVHTVAGGQAGAGGMLGMAAEEGGYFTSPHPPDQPGSPTGTKDDSKPPYSYAQLIVQAISSAVDKQLTLSGIYSYITKHYPYYRTADKGWQNSIRHNLSLNRYFVKVPRSQEEPGKGSFWRIDPPSEGKLVDQAFKRRRQRGVPIFKTPFSHLATRSAPTSPSHIGMSGLVTPDSLSREGSPTPSDHYHDSAVHYQHDSGGGSSSATTVHYSDSSNSSHYHDGNSTATLHYHDGGDDGGGGGEQQQYEVVAAGTPQSPVRHITTQGGKYILATSSGNGSGTVMKTIDGGAAVLEGGVVKTLGGIMEGGMVKTLGSIMDSSGGVVKTVGGIVDTSGSMVKTVVDGGGGVVRTIGGVVKSLGGGVEGGGGGGAPTQQVIIHQGSSDHTTTQVILPSHLSKFSGFVTVNGELKRVLHTTNIGTTPNSNGGGATSYMSTTTSGGGGMQQKQQPVVLGVVTQNQQQGGQIIHTTSSHSSLAGHSNNNGTIATVTHQHQQPKQIQAQYHIKQGVQQVQQQQQHHQGLQQHHQDNNTIISQYETSTGNGQQETTTTTSIVVTSESMAPPCDAASVTTSNNNNSGTAEPPYKRPRGDIP